MAWALTSNALTPQRTTTLTQRIINTPNAPAAVGAYNQGKQIGSFLQLSGQLAIDPATGTIMRAEVAEQTKQSLSQLTTLLAEAGASWNDVLITRVYLASDDDFDEFDKAYGSSVPQPFPARVTVGAQLAPGALVEIDALAIVPA
jgi:2-iminobutanoate/2-iminopropanoate deaminase